MLRKSWRLASQESRGWEWDLRLISLVLLQRLGWGWPAGVRRGSRNLPKALLLGASLPRPQLVQKWVQGPRPSSSALLSAVGRLQKGSSPLPSRPLTAGPGPLPSPHSPERAPSSPDFPRPSLRLSPAALLRSSQGAAPGPELRLFPPHLA